MASWLPDFFYILQDGIVASENIDSLFDNVSIINFNYDRCIEQFLFGAIRDLYQTDDQKTARLVSKLRMFHPYGRVGFLPWQEEKRRVGFGVTDYGELVGLSSEIRTFNEQVEEGDELEAMREEVARAERIVFLGFHFHQQNMDLLKAKGPKRGNSTGVYATAVQRSGPDVNIIGKQIEQMLDERGRPVHLAVHSELDCKGLFKNYSTSFLQ